MSKFKIEQLKQEFKDKGWELVSNEYVNLKTDLQAICPEGHTCLMSYEKFRKGYQCPTCKQNQYYKVSEIPAKKSGFRVLAFDQASQVSGWAVFDDEKLISYGKWTSTGIDSVSRIAQTKQWVASMIDKWKPNQVILEDIQLQKNEKDDDMVWTFKTLAHLQGVLINYFYEMRVNFDVVAVATWRNFSEIKGKTRTDKKKNAQLKVKRFYDISITQDEADAILIGRWAAHKKKATQIIEF